MSVLTSAERAQATDAGAAPRPTPPVRVWAFVGAAATAFQAYVLIRWVTGPYFKRVASGPAVPPHWMRILIPTYEAVSVALMLLTAYWCIVRPWRRGRGMTLDGMLVLMWFQLYWICDPLFDYGGEKFTFNAYAFNMGSWVPYVPGWLAPAHPGAMVPEPFLWVAPIYVYICFPGTVA